MLSKKIQARKRQGHIPCRLMKWWVQTWKAHRLEFWKSRPTVQIHRGSACSWWQLPAPFQYQWGQFCSLHHHWEENQLASTGLFLGHWDLCFGLLVLTILINKASFHSNWLFSDFCLLCLLISLTRDLLTLLVFSKNWLWLNKWSLFKRSVFISFKNSSYFP